MKVMTERSFIRMHQHFNSDNISMMIGSLLISLILYDHILYFHVINFSLLLYLQFDCELAFFSIFVLSIFKFIL